MISVATPQCRWEELVKKGLPVLPRGAAKLLQALNDENMGFAEVAEVIAQYPSVAMRVLAVANSAWSSPVSSIDSLDQACARLGFKVVRSMSIAIAVASPFDFGACARFDAETYWTSAMLVARAAEQYAEEMGEHAAYPAPVAGTLGILSNLGLLMLATHLPNETDAAFAQVERDSCSVLEATAEHCGLNYVQAGAYLTRCWKLPTSLIDELEQQAEDIQLAEDTAQRCSPLSLAVISEQAVRKPQQAEFAPLRHQRACRLVELEFVQSVHDDLTAAEPRIRELARSMGL